MANNVLINLIGGGMLIGLAAAVLILVNGRVAGISGITGRLIRGEAGAQVWRLLFLAGLLLPALVPGALGAISAPASPAVLALAGLLVGVGVTIGAGCTSGHGVCGIANFSRRSLAATLMFMATAGLTVFVVRHVIGGAS